MYGFMDIYYVFWKGRRVLCKFILFTSLALCKWLCRATDATDHGWATDATDHGCLSLSQILCIHPKIAVWPRLGSY